MRSDSDYTRHWDDKFRSRDWGRYPPEDLVRFMGRNFKQAQRESIKVLEVGCGPGANLWFLHREGYAVSGIDCSPTAIELASARLCKENKDVQGPPPDLRVGNFSELPWPNSSFDVVIDIFALYANTTGVIIRTLSGIARVLRPGGRFYSKVWGTGTTGYGTGTSLEPGTFDAIPVGPCFNMGVAHFFDRNEIEQMYGRFFRARAIDSVVRSDVIAQHRFEEFHCDFEKA